jgi:hypothetical protein
MKQKGLLILIWLLSALPNLTMAQKIVIPQELIWLSYFNTLKIKEVWVVQTDIQQRFFTDPVQQHQLVFRSQVGRKVGENRTAFVGLCYFLQSPNDPKASSKLMVPEWRPHIEWAHQQKLKRFRLDHRYRAEARFFRNTDINRTALEEGFHFGNFRFRYRAAATIQLWEWKPNCHLNLRVSDEIQLNAGRNIDRNVFDQNRLYGGVQWELSPQLALEAGYLNWFQQRTNGEFYQRHILRFSVFQTIVLKGRGDG